jgi:hypothetical protein
LSIWQLLWSFENPGQIWSLSSSASGVSEQKSWPGGTVLWAYWLHALPSKWPFCASSSPSVEKNHEGPPHRCL